MGIERLSMIACLGVLVALVVGCAQQRAETGYHDFDRVQIQFYAPAGALVTLGDKTFGTIVPDRSHQINIYEDHSFRLERSPEETATFNLRPGHYEFKYTGATGWEGASVYGNIEVFRVSEWKNPGAKMMLRKSFIPIALPSPVTPAQVTVRDDIFPYASPAHRLRISYQDIERIAAGDMVTKVIFIADLQKTRTELDRLELDYITMRGNQQRLLALLNEAQLDAIEDPRSREFIRIQTDLAALEQGMDRNRQRFFRLQALVQADTVLTRREMMVLATDEILPPHEDPVAAARELGQVVLVMRLGGRHLHWGHRAQEAFVFNR